MKNALLSILTLVVFHSTGMACPGGHLIQVVDQNGTVIANYNKRTGAMEARNMSYTINSVSNFGTSDEAPESDSDFSGSLCEGQSCETLKKFDNKDILVWFTHLHSGRKESVVIHDVTVGDNAPVSRGLKVSLPIQDSEKLVLIGCSKH